MLAGLVLASFTVTGERRAPQSVTPTDDGATEARIRPLSRGVIRGLRDFDDPDPTPSPAPADTAAVVASGGPSAEATGDPEPEAITDPTVEPTAEPTPPPQRSIARPVGAITNPTTLWAERHMLELINASRAQGGLAPLETDIGVADTARAHSAAEAQARYVYHDGPDGTAHSRDVPACATGWYGENTGKIWNDNVDALHSEFMNEPWAPINHRTNIMDPAFRRVGIGAVIGADAMYMTMVFCR